MNTEELQSIQEKLIKELDPKRYQHTLGVAFTAVALAMCYGMDIEQAYLAGILHDCAKGMKAEELLCFCKKNALNLSEVEKKNTALLHAKVGSVLAKEKYHIEDLEIRSAILYHTTGHPDMTKLEKIIFISDYIEPFRTHDTTLSELRKLVYKDMDKCLYLILEHTVTYLRSSGKEIDPMTEITYNYYKEKDIKNESISK